MNQHDRTTRVFAAVLAIGGIFGVVSIAKALYWGIGETYFRPVGIGVGEFLLFGFAGLFVWTIDTGVAAWQGTPSGRRWAVILFASQIPVFNMPAVKFWWTSGVSLVPYITLGADFRPTANLNFSWLLGASYSVRLFGRATEQYFIGANLFAVLAVILLVRAWKRPRQIRVEEVF